MSEEKAERAEGVMSGNAGVSAGGERAEIVERAGESEQ